MTSAKLQLLIEQENLELEGKQLQEIQKALKQDFYRDIKEKIDGLHAQYVDCDMSMDQICIVRDVFTFIKNNI